MFMAGGFWGLMITHKFILSGFWAILSNVPPLGGRLYQPEEKRCLKWLKMVHVIVLRHILRATLISRHNF